MKINILILFLLFQLISCQKNNNKNGGTSNAITTVSGSQPDFINYPVDDLEGITSTQYVGIYRNFDFKYQNGETTFILVPKTGAKKWYSEQVHKIDSQDADQVIEKNLNKQTFKTLSKDFNIWVFQTPKEYLKHTPHMDAPYTPRIPRKIFLYQYISEDNKWIVADTFSVREENDEAKAREWRERIISKFNINVSADLSHTASLKDWTGIYLNSDNKKLTDYQKIKEKIGWYELKISPEKITFSNDDRMESEFPTESPGGYSINYDCDFNISENTIKLYEKNEDDTSPPKSISGKEQKLILILTRKDNAFYGTSDDIKNAENLVNSARAKSKSPYLFYKFDLNTTN